MNTLFIQTDQQNRHTLSAYGSTPCKTPNLDRFAQESVVFHNAYTVCAVCTPARASLQTGLYPFRHGMAQNLFNPGCIVHELGDGPHLLSRKLEAAGIQRGFTGKWHLGYGRHWQGFSEAQNHQRGFGDCLPASYREARGMPTDVGYTGDDFPGHGNGGLVYPEFQDFLARQGRVRQVVGEFNDPADAGGEVTSGIETTNEYFLTERTRKIIRGFRESEHPWTTQLHYWGPHTPYYPTTECLDLYRDRPMPKPASFDEDQSTKPRLHAAHRYAHADWPRFEKGLRHYYAYMTMIDSEMGRLFEWMKAEGIYDETLIIITSDHGDSQGCHGRLRNKAFNMYEEVMGIPLMIKPPKHTGIAPRNEHHFVQTCDLHATLADIDCDGRGDTVHGRSLWPLLKNPAAEWRDTLVSEGSGVGGVGITQRMCRYQHFKYVWNLGDRDELYDLSTDPHEMRNLAVEAASADLLKAMQERLLDWMRVHGDRAAGAFAQTTI